MATDRAAVAARCLAAAYDATASFPEIVGTLMAAGFEGYLVDYRAGTNSYYTPDAAAVTIAMPHGAVAVAAGFDSGAVAGLVRWAQANEADYSYAGFCDRVTAAGCAGYLVSFPGRRVVYFGRGAEMHVEEFPQ